MAGNLSDDAQQSEERKVTGAVNWCPTIVGNHSGEQRRVITGHGDATEVSRYVAQDRETAVTGELILIHCCELGTMAEIIYWPKLIHGSMTSSVIRSTRARIETAATRIAAKRSSAARN